jgi:hypothetical protein
MALPWRSGRYPELWFPDGGRPGTPAWVPFGGVVGSSIRIMRPVASRVPSTSRTGLSLPAQRRLHPTRRAASRSPDRVCGGDQESTALKKRVISDDPVRDFGLGDGIVMIPRMYPRRSNSRWSPGIGARYVFRHVPPERVVCWPGAISGHNWQQPLVHSPSVCF